MTRSGIGQVGDDSGSAETHSIAPSIVPAVAASPATTASSTTAAASTPASATAATTTRTGLAGPGFVDCQATTIVLLVV